MNKKLLITGGAGFVGYNFLKLNLSGWNVFATVHQKKPETSFVNCLPSDIAHEASLKKLFDDLRPDAVVHLAALSDANYCQQNQEVSRAVNVASGVQLASLCAHHQIPFLFASTDLVFDGTQGNYSETDAMNPLNVYGKQKTDAEKEILSIHPHACVLRLPLMFGDGGIQAQSFIQPFIAQLKNGATLHLFTDEYRSVAGGYSVSKGILLALHNNWKGIYHLGGKEKISRYAFGIMLCEVFGFDASLIIPTLQKDVAMPAPRPSDVSLNSSKAFAAGYEPMLVKEELFQIFRK